MTVVGLISLVCLVITGGIAAWGVFSRHFEDSLTQRIGLSGISIACLLRVPSKFGSEYVPPEILLAQISLSIYAVGCVMVAARQLRSSSNIKHNNLHRTHDSFFGRIF